MKVDDQLSVPLIIQEHAGVRRIREPVSVGIPLRRGLISDSKSLALLDDRGRQCPLQTTTLASWFDGSLKWVLLDFQADAEPNNEAVFQLLCGGKQPVELPSERVSVQETAAQIVVHTGTATFFLNRHLCKPFDTVVVKDDELLAMEGSSLFLTDESGATYLPQIDDFAIETHGPIRVTITARGEMRSANGVSLARFVVRLSFFVNSGCVQAQLTLHNPKAAHHPAGLWDLGDEGSIYFKDLSLHIPLRSQTSPQVRWTTNYLHPLRNTLHPLPNTLHPDPDPLLSDLEIYQDSSGGENWRSTNHVNRLGQVMQSFRGYRVTVGDSLFEEGLRATPIVAIRGNRGEIVATIEKFWQNFPKALEANGKELVLRFFPHQFGDVFELQGGEQKTHTIYLQFSTPEGKQADFGWVHDRLLPRATPEWYAETKVIGYLSPVSQDSNVECRELIDGAIAGPRSFFARREIIDEYGWRHFGDLYADHEAVGHSGETPLVAHYNNQYDVIYGAIVQYLRSSGRRWFDLMADLARHVIDIDIYHTQEDRPAYNGGLFWHTDHYLDAGTATHRSYSKANLRMRKPSSYGGGPSNEHNYTSGLLHYYYLTGDETAREAVLSLADWVINMDNGSRRFLGWLDTRPTGFSSSSASRDYHGPGRGAGNSLNALVDAYSLTRQHHYLVKTEELIQRCVHPHDDFQSKCLEDVEHHWSYLVFLQSLGKYLDCKSENSGADHMYQYARASFVHYAHWMLDHEVPYGTVLHKVELPTETWPAQDIRKSVIFHMAAKYAHGKLCNAFRQKAGFFFQACLRDLRSFPTCTLTRPIALLMSYAHVHAYFQRKTCDPVPQPSESYSFGKPAKFSPQFSELYWIRDEFQAVLGGLKHWGQGFTATTKNITSSGESNSG